MGNTKPCRICGEMTSRLLFKEKKSDIAVCSERCEYEYIKNISRSTTDRTNLLDYLDARIDKTKRDEKRAWAAAGAGLLLATIGLLVPNVETFLVGIFPLTIGAISTRHFEDKREKLRRLRMRIGI